MKNIVIRILVMIGVVVIVVVAAEVYIFDFTDGGTSILPERGCTMEAKLCPDGSAVGRSGPLCEFAACPTASATNENIRVISPHPGDVIKNPLTITGEARGAWFFEGSFPISLVGDNGMILGSGVAQAKGDWMTTEYVLFEATVVFSTPSSVSGLLILSRDNPSGLPENDAKIAFPIRF